MEGVSLENKITCGICEKHFTEPKVLPCLHCYCKDCVVNLVQQAGPGEPIVCPQCQYKTTLPSGDVNALKTASFINRLKIKLERENRLGNTLEAKCELCVANSNAEKFCLHCNKFICIDCAVLHSKLKDYLAHKISSLADLKENLANAVLVEEPSAMCPVHNHPLDFYCYDCKSCICRFCSLKREVHEHHQYDKTNLLISKTKNNFKNELHPIKELHQRLNCAAMVIDKAKDDARTQEESNLQKLSASFNDLHKILDDRQQELENRIKKLAVKKMDSLMVQEKCVSLAFAEIQSIVEFTELFMAHSVDDEFMNMHDVIKKRIDQILCERGRILKASKPKIHEEVVVDKACAKEQREFSRSLVFVTEQNCRENSVETADEDATTVKCEVCYDLTYRKAFCTKISSVICPSCADGNVVLLDTSTVIKPPNTKCPVHKEELLVYHCLKCQVCICSQCRSVEEDHEHHNLERLVKAAGAARDELLHQVSYLPDLHGNIKEILKKVNDARCELKDQEKTVVSSVRDSFTALRDVLLLSEQDCIENVQIITYEKLRKLLEQEKQLHSADEKVQSIANFTKECVNHLPDADVMKLGTPLAQRIKLEVENQEDLLKRNLKPVERADIGVKVLSTESLRDLCKTGTSIITKIDPLKCFVEMNQTTEVSVPFKATLITGIGDSPLTKRKGKIAVTVESQSGSVTDCTIKDDGPGLYTVQFTPSVRGQHWLTILVDKQHVVGSPFPIVATVSPASLKKPVKVWNDIVKPYGGTVSSKCDILCIENYKAIIQLAPDGHNTVIVHDCGLQKLSSIACDKEDNIYGIDELSNRMFTCDKNGDNTQLHEVELINGTGRGVLIILDNELVTTDRGETQDTLCVYDREFNLINSTELTYKISDMCADSHGNIYTTDTDNCCIRIFDKHGVQLETFNLDKKGMQYPRRIFIFDQHVYLTGCTNHCMAVFTTDGAYIASLGQAGELEIDSNYPLKVFVDLNGFIYILDFFNDRILCF